MPKNRHGPRQTHSHIWITEVGLSTSIYEDYLVLLPGGRIGLRILDSMIVLD